MDNLISASKLLSYVLRHKPETIGLTLDNNGWAKVDELLNQLKIHGHDIDAALLNEVVEKNNKKRFKFSDDRTQIRASQGHSITIDLGYTPQPPPEILYHGTAVQHLESILKEGIIKKSRQHVHLSKDTDTAMSVGSRHGKPVILNILAADMYKDGYHFYLSDNGVWLTDEVPARYITR